MARFEECLRFVLQHEGGFSDDPNDPGGATNFGITQRVYDDDRANRGVPHRSVRDVEMSEVEHIYRQRYWFAGKCDRLPRPLDLVHFDSAVNMGVGTAGRMLQTALVMTVVDGIVGKKTLEAAKAAGLVTVLRYVNLRSTRYIVLAKENPRLLTFLRGWAHRLGDLLQAI